MTLPQFHRKLHRDLMRAFGGPAIARRARWAAFAIDMAAHVVALRLSVAADWLDPVDPVGER